MPAFLLHDLAHDLSRVYGSALLFPHVPCGELPDWPQEEVDDLGSFLFVNGVLDDGPVTLLR